MANSVKAELSEKVTRRNYIKIALVGTFSVLGLGLAIYSIIKMSYLVSLVYLFAGIMGVLYTIIEINLTRVPKIECDDENLMLRTWNNGVLPYRIDFKPRFFADFVPAKSICYNLVLNDIADLAIGSKGFLSRTLKNQDLEKKFTELSSLSKRAANFVKRSDLLCVRLKDDSIYLMSVKDFDLDELYGIVDKVEHCVQGLEFKTGIRKLRKKRETI